MAKITNKNNTFGRNKFTLKKQEDFLAELAVNGGNVTMAAKTVQTYARNVYHLAKENPDFDAAFRQAQRLGLTALEDECRRRAMKGVERAVFYQGEEVGTETLYSDTLAMFLLKGGMPEKYRDNLNVTGSMGTVQMTQEECEAFALKRMEEIRAAREAKENE